MFDCVVMLVYCLFKIKRNIYDFITIHLVFDLQYFDLTITLKIFLTWLFLQHAGYKYYFIVKQLLITLESRFQWMILHFGDTVQFQTILQSRGPGIKSRFSRLQNNLELNRDLQIHLTGFNTISGFRWFLRRTIR